MRSFLPYCYHIYHIFNSESTSLAGFFTPLAIWSSEPAKPVEAHPPAPSRRVRKTITNEKSWKAQAVCEIRDISSRIVFAV